MDGIKKEVERLSSSVDRLEKTVYTGNGTPALTVTVGIIKNKLDLMFEMLEKTNNNIDTLMEFKTAEISEKNTKDKIQNRKIKFIRIWLSFISGMIIGLGGIILQIFLK